MKVPIPIPLLLFLGLLSFLIVIAVEETAIAYETSDCQFLKNWFSGEFTMNKDYGSAVAGTKVTSYGKLYVCPDGVNYLLTDWGLIPEWMMRFTDPSR